MENHSQNPVIRKAEEALAKAMGAKPEDVRIGTGELRDDGIISRVGGEENKTTNLVLNIRNPDVEINPEKARKDILQQLRELAPIREIAQTLSDKDLAVKMHGKLKEAAQGTNFNPKLLEWSGFDQKIAEKGGWELGDHAVSYVNNNAYGVNVHLSVPANSESDKDLVGKIEDNIKARLPEIKNRLGERVEKYTKLNMQKEGKSEDEITAALAKAKEDMAKLEIAIKKSAGGSNYVEVSFRSPEQAEAVKKATDQWSTPDNSDALTATNPLSKLSAKVTDAELKTNPNAGSQLNKSLSRAILFAGGEKATEVFPLIAGRRDIMNAIAKEARAAVQQHPEKAEAFKEILSSNIFKNHNGGAKDAGAALAKPIFKKDAAKPDEVQVVISISKDKVQPTLEALAALSQQHQTLEQQPEPGAAPSPSVDNISMMQNVLHNVAEKLGLGDGKNIATSR